MDPNTVHIVQAVMIVPVVAIIGGIAAGVIKMILRHEEQRERMRFQSTGAGNEAWRAEIETLRQELSRLRDTSTQYDVSIQHTLEDLQQRMERLEARRAVGGMSSASALEETEQIVSVGSAAR